MKLFNKKILTNLLIICLILGGAYSYRNEIKLFIEDQIRLLKPCARPIAYSLGSFDKNFGITQKEFLNFTLKAEEIWESQIGKQLFKYDANGDQNSRLKINLIYDNRQQMTDEQKRAESVISKDKAIYEDLKSKYTSLSNEYQKDLNNLENLISNFQTQKNAYEKEVAYWNSKGGAPKDKFQELEKQRIILNTKADEINKIQNNFAKQVEIINNLGSELNNLSSAIKNQVDTFNSTRKNGEEFNEGEYISDGKNEVINIYQFENKNKLFRVLAHELGHAIGIEHVNNKEAIMYRLNESPNEKLMPEDIEALKKICGIK